MAVYNLPLAAGKVHAARTNFAFYQGNKSNQVYISAQPAGPRQIAELNEECGDPKRLFKGVCFVEGEQFVFATKAKPSMVWEVLITKVFKEKKASKFLPIVLRQLGVNESDEATAGGTENGAPGGTAATAAPAAEDTAAASAEGALDDEGEWRKTKAEVAPLVTAAIKANPPNREELLALLAKALAREKAGEFSDARSIFFQLMALTSPPSPGGAPPPPPPPPAGRPPGGKALSASELSVAMKNIVPRLQQAVAANPARRAEILASAGKFQAALNAGKLGEAQAAMLEALAVVKALAPAAPPPDPAQEAAFAATWDSATKVWLDCVGTVDGQIEKIRAAMQTSGDPDFEEIADRGLTALTGDHKTPVMVALREVSNASGSDRPAAVAKARAAVESFRKHLLSDERVAVCDEECEAEFGVKLTIRDEINRGLDELEGALKTVPGA